MTQIETCHRGNIASYIRGFAGVVGMHLRGQLYRILGAVALDL